MSTRTYSVEGMTCEHCVNAVTSEVSKLDGVSSVEVDLGTNTVTPTSSCWTSSTAIRGSLFAC